MEREQFFPKTNNSNTKMSKYHTNVEKTYNSRIKLETGDSSGRGKLT
jgi:hypothetical protein